MLLSLLSRRSLEVDSRDAYGFAVRPHHLKRYQEYVDIYQEEEEERSDKWKFFLEQHEAKSDNSCSSEKEEEEEEELYRQFLEDDITDFIFSTSGAEWNDCTQKDEEDYRQLLEDDIIDFIFSTQNDSTQNNSYFSGPTECDPENGVQCEKELEKKVHLSAKPKEQFQPSEETEKKLPKKPWSSIRPSLGVIENMMSSRFKTKNDMKDEQNKSGGNNLGTIQEKGSMEEDGEDDIEEEEVVDKFFDCSMNNSTDKTIAKNMAPGQFFPQKQELELLVQGGVPKALRGEVWQAFVGAKERRVESYYEELLAGKTNAEEGTDHHTTTGARRKWERQIEKDIPRTFPGHPALDERGRDSLRRLLVAYARHNPSVGYCQAMNFFAGLLLLLMPEENAFWTFMGIIDDYFEGYYTEEMIESQVDQLVLEELMRERFPKLVKHLDFLGVQVAWISGPWFLSIFVNMLPWESVLRIWDVLLFEGNQVMMFRTALALMDLYGPALVTTRDAGDAITLLQSLTGSTFDSSQLVLTACMGFLAVNETRLQELREKHRPAVLLVVEERTRGRVSKESKGLASKLYSFKHDRGSTTEGKKANGGQKHLSEPHSSELDDLLTGLTADSENGSPPDLQEQVVWFKVELCRVLEEKRSAILRAEELETALMEMVKADNRREMSAKIEELELEIDELHQALEDKKEQENAMLQVLIRVEHEQRIAEEALLNAENNSAAQRHALKLLEEKYEKSVASLAEMEQRVVVAESTLEATLQYHSGQAKALSSPRHVLNQQSSVGESPRRRISLFRLGWRDRNKGKPSNEDSDGSVHSNDGRDPGASSK